MTSHAIRNKIPFFDEINRIMLATSMLKKNHEAPNDLFLLER